ncbi:hypothetical protein H0H87_007160 [Tephrocybe sp. NHM501043]|nr:hypothetical protein H0H87_007160 [Tephrocybe sp. NHM501043]
MIAGLAGSIQNREEDTGVYYMAPLLGPVRVLRQYKHSFTYPISQSIGPILGGGLTTGIGWRAIFWFLSIVAGFICLVFIIFFRDTFRKERSLTYQNVLRKRLEDAELKHNKLKGETRSTDPEKGPNQNGIPTVQLSIKDVNPIKPLVPVLRRLNNLVIFFASGAWQWYHNRIITRLDQNYRSSPCIRGFHRLHYSSHTQ